MKLSELEPGELFRYKDCIALKTEYRTDAGAIESFIVQSGEMFWGGTSKPEDQVNLEIESLELLELPNEAD